jgi:hypothetical protein
MKYAEVSPALPQHRTKVDQLHDIIKSTCRCNYFIFNTWKENFHFPKTFWLKYQKLIILYPFQPPHTYRKLEEYEILDTANASKFRLEPWASQWTLTG